jgi:cyclic beta-1,2-glucan synthetase
VWAFAELGQGDRAVELFRLLNPIRHSDTAEKAARYRVEPYVAAADVYSAKQHLGQGGWTWYTGSSGWMARLGLEAILGLKKVGDTLRIDPCIPQDWSAYEMTYRYQESVYRIRVENPDSVNRGVARVLVDEDELENEQVPLTDDGEEHRVRVILG